MKTYLLAAMKMAAGSSLLLAGIFGTCAASRLEPRVAQQPQGKDLEKPADVKCVDLKWSGVVDRIGTWGPHPYPECKCQGQSNKLYCGTEQVGDRKFVVDEINADPRCQWLKEWYPPYCADSADRKKVVTPKLLCDILPDLGVIHQVGSSNSMWFQCLDPVPGRGFLGLMACFYADAEQTKQECSVSEKYLNSYALDSGGAFNIPLIHPSNEKMTQRLRGRVFGGALVKGMFEIVDEVEDPAGGEPIVTAREFNGGVKM